MNTAGDRPAERITENIFLVDTFYLGREKFAASYFIEDHGEIAVIETNTNFAVPRILDAVRNEGFSLSDIKYVILTHIHLDHAGGAGLLMKALPDAQLIVHPRGAKHMISPELLIESVKSVYGEKEYKKLYGDIIGIRGERVVSKTGGEIITVGHRKLKLIESPGHAKHHNVIYDELSGSVFSGDAFGIGYPRFRYDKGDLLFPSTSPVQFDPDSALNTYRLIAGLNPSRILLTHFGSIENIEEARIQLELFIKKTCDAASRRYSEGLTGNDLDKTIITDIWGMFDDRILELTGSPLSSEEKEHLFFDAELNGKGAGIYISRART